MDRAVGKGLEVYRVTLEDLGRNILERVRQ